MAEQGSISTEVLPFPTILLEDGSLGQLRTVLWESQPMGWQPGGLHCAGASDRAGSPPLQGWQIPLEGLTLSAWPGLSCDKPAPTASNILSQPGPELLPDGCQAPSRARE